MTQADSLLGQASPSSPSGAPRQGVVVLHGGQVFAGRVTRAGDIYHVVLSNGEIRLRANQVAFHCESLQEAYQRRRETIRAGHVESHLEMARWCRHNGLFDEGLRELGDAAAVDPGNPWIPHLERSLRAAAQHYETPELGDEPAKALGPTSSDLDRMVRQLSPQSVAAFTSAVQPLLLNSCATGGCHGPNSESQFRLMRGREGGSPSRRVTQRNLHATLEWIDHEQPEASPLLTEAIRAHGKAGQAAFTDKDAMKFRQIAQWVHGIARTAPSEMAGPKTIDSRGLAEARAMTAGPVEPSRETRDSQADFLVSQAGFSEHPSEGIPFDQPPATNGAIPEPTRSPVKRGADIERFVPADPFDPEIFNRRHHPDR
ncbi:MAG: hypothetical protein GX621_02610 [Pirellulaceae bacterium]|nr:hypothetical protein [Pirellulaceae bacterium]